ncbi:MAG: hypothetical protein KAS12_04930 [Candidatus Aenigmarchaeota archaeon]|nr:hypothetical protein [Candidatus Aenigmarchaeota archaeon]
MNYALIGPFNLDEARAMSTSYVWECLPCGRGDTTHLESAGRTAITNANILSTNQSSSHGNYESTVRYCGTKIVLCQIEKPSVDIPSLERNFESLKGYYLVESTIVKSFQGGLLKLLDDKCDFESELNRQFRKTRAYVKKKIDELNKLEENITDEMKLYLNLIDDSNIFEEPNMVVLENLKLRLKNDLCRCVDKEELSEFLDYVYVGNTRDPEKTKRWVLQHLGCYK